MHHEVRYSGVPAEHVHHLVAKLDRSDHPQMQHNRETTSARVQQSSSRWCENRHCGSAQAALDTCPAMALAD
jgi:hypothetical protein